MAYAITPGVMNVAVNITESLVMISMICTYISKEVVNLHLFLLEIS